MIHINTILPAVAITPIAIAVTSLIALIIYAIKGAAKEREEERSLPDFDDSGLTRARLPQVIIPILLGLLLVSSIIRVNLLGSEGVTAWSTVTKFLEAVLLAIFVYLLVSREDLEHGMKWKGIAVAALQLLYMVGGETVNTEPVKAILCLAGLVMVIIFLVSLHQNDFRSLARQSTILTVLYFALMLFIVFADFWCVAEGDEGPGAASCARNGFLLLLLLRYIVEFNLLTKLAKGRSINRLDRNFNWIGTVISCLYALFLSIAFAALF